MGQPRISRRCFSFTLIELLDDFVLIGDVDFQILNAGTRSGMF